MRTGTALDELVPERAAGGIALETTTAPPGFDVAGAQWIEIHRPDGHDQLAAVFLPHGRSPLGTVVLLHGSSGLARAQLEWGPRLVAAGYRVLAGCYLAADAQVAAAIPTAFVPCEGLPPNDPFDTAAVSAAYRALLSTAHALGGTPGQRLGVVGVSFGAGVALDVADPTVAAIIADSGHGFAAPSATGGRVLFLGNTTDPNVPHADVVAYEEALRRAGRAVEDHYYETTGHITILTAADIDDATRRITRFLDEELKT
ncbi:MAG: Dienelactone hydrolase family [Actinomycetota bacterium]|nr:Dienelactone hydrolase family [Actinomycetota bacterium]